MKKIPKPNSQIQEVLYELINRLYIDRKTMMLSADVLNLTAIISKLRLKKVKIISNPSWSKNKYGREIKTIHYSIENKKHAVAIYRKMQDQQTKIFYQNESNSTENHS